MSGFFAQLTIETLRMRVKDAVLRRQAGLPVLHDPGELLEGALRVIDDLEKQVSDLEEELGSDRY